MFPRILRIHINNKEGINISYIRPANKDEVESWLIDIDYESLDREDLATALVEKWDLVGFFSSPS